MEDRRSGDHGPKLARGGSGERSAHLKKRKATLRRTSAEAATELCALVAGSGDRTWSEAALVIAETETASKDHFATVPGSDPKHALRLAWRRQGSSPSSLTCPSPGRFLWSTGPVGPGWTRCGNSARAAPQPARRGTKGGPTRTPARSPVAVRMRSGGDSGTMEGWDVERAEWLPYPRMLLSLVQGANHAQAPLARAQDLERQIRTVLFQLRYRLTLLMVNSGNIQQCWPRLRNGALSRDMLGFGGGADQRLAAYGEGLRVVSGPRRQRAGRGARVVCPRWEGGHLLRSGFLVIDGCAGESGLRVRPAPLPWQHDRRG